MVESDTDIPIQRDNAGRVEGCEECVRGERRRIMLYHGFPLSRFDIGSCAACLYFRSSGLAALGPTWYS